MGNNQPGYHTFGLLFGQLCQYKNFTKPIDPKLIKKVESLKLEGQKYLITGASSGIGKEMSKLLIQQGASIIMVSRKLENLSKAEQEICQNIVLQEGQSIEKQECDLSDLNAVDSLVGRLKDSKLDGIINNGGVLPSKQIIKHYQSQEIEETVAAHVVSPYKIVKQLKDSLNQQSIVINNTSAGLYSQKLNVNLIQQCFKQCLKKDDAYKDGALVYAQCKRAMLVMTDILSQQVQNVKIVSVHPGWCDTPGLKPLFEQQPQYQAVKFRQAIDSAYGILSILAEPNLVDAGFYYDGENVVKHRTFAGTKESVKEREKLENYLLSFIK